MFQGQRLDEESGLYYFKNRYYDPTHGRFISRDPSGFADGPNLYAFVNNNPVNYVDSLGLWHWDATTRTWVQDPQDKEAAEKWKKEKEEIIKRLLVVSEQVTKLRNNLTNTTDIDKKIEKLKAIDQYAHGDFGKKWFLTEEEKSDIEKHPEKYRTEEIKSQIEALEKEKSESFMNRWNELNKVEIEWTKLTGQANDLEAKIAWAEHYPEMQAMKEMLVVIGKMTDDLNNTFGGCLLKIGIPLIISMATQSPWAVLGAIWAVVDMTNYISRFESDCKEMEKIYSKYVPAMGTFKLGDVFGEKGKDYYFWLTYRFHLHDVNEPPEEIIIPSP